MINIKEYFDSILTHNDIRYFVQNRTPEGIYIDFKIYRSANKDAEKDLKKTLSKAASGFAHQHGGVIIWGILANDSDTGDYAHSLELIENLTNFLTMLNRLSRDAVEPRLKILHEPIYENDDPKTNKGFIKSFFPASSEIHRACFEKYDFYRRFGDNHFPIQTKEELLSLLNRNKVPELKLKITSQISSYSKDSTGKTIAGSKSYIFSLLNEGNEVAESPSVLIKSKNSFGRFYDPLGGTDFSLGEFIPTSDRNTKQFIPKGNLSIHPSQEVNIGSTRFEGIGEVLFEYKCYAKNMIPFEGSLRI